MGYTGLPIRNRKLLEIDAESHSHDSDATLAQGDLSRSLSGQPLPFLPYQFEPEAEDSDSDEEPGGDRGNEERLSSLNWCSCGHCNIMPTAAECLCCREVQLIDEKRNLLVRPVPECITMHEGFRSICLDIWSLQCAYFEYRQQYGHRQDATHEAMTQCVLKKYNFQKVKPVSFRRYRYIAYRRLVRWCWGWLGEGIRVVLPACAVTKIRETFPSEQYAGFRYPPLD
ncbi:uncharacterized protein [Branchiostoma lanceolatum]|uniref:uncharacterized protein n=1 Tax=Branchiostoma lanceolatum TaxID=7740 RepID=UPI0034566097